MIFLLAGCGGDDDSSTGPGGSVGFTSDNPNPGSNSVALQQHSGGSDAITLSVQVVDVQNVYGAAFEIFYPAAVLDFRSYAAGSFLSGDGAPTTVQVSENPTGTLIIGVTRLGDAGGISGSGDLLLLTFDASAQGSGRIDFNAASLRDPQNNVIPGVSFIGGSVTVVF
jgi:hypothetical protein